MESNEGKGKVHHHSCNILNWAQETQQTIRAGLLLCSQEARQGGEILCNWSCVKTSLRSAQIIAYSDIHGSVCATGSNGGDQCTVSRSCTLASILEPTLAYEQFTVMNRAPSGKSSLLDLACLTPGGWGWWVTIGRARLGVGM